MSTRRECGGMLQQKKSRPSQSFSKSLSVEKRYKKHNKKHHLSESDDGEITSDRTDKRYKRTKHGKKRLTKHDDAKGNRAIAEDNMGSDDGGASVDYKARDGEDKRQDERDRDYRNRDNYTKSYNRDYRYNDYERTYREREKEESFRGREQQYSNSRRKQYGEKAYERKEHRGHDEQERNENSRVEKSSKVKDQVRGKLAETELQPEGQSVKPAGDSQKKVVDMLTSMTGGAYIPPAKLKMMLGQINNKASYNYQKIAWQALKKSIHGLINKVNTGNLATIVRELFKENLVRGCGLLCRSIIQAQAASPTFTKVYAALMSVINSRFPKIGELLLKRVVIRFRRALRRNDKSTCISSAIFIAHLVNQEVAHELLALEILVLLMKNPTSDSVEIAIAFLKEVIEKLLKVTKKGTMAIQDMLRNILHEGTLDKRVQYMIEVMFQIIKVGGTKEGEEDNQPEGLVDKADQITHIIDVNLDEATAGQDIVNDFKLDPDYEANEASYKKLRQEILGEEHSDEDEDETDDSGDEEKSKDVIIDRTETNLVALRRTIYLTIQSSLDFEECAHKLLLMQLKPGQEMEMCHMILDCCAEMRSYEKFFGLLAQRFCMINKMYVGPFQEIFIDSYATIHRLEINQLRNVAKLFAHLLFTLAISWEVLSTCRLTEEDSNSSSRIFVKILFQELSEYMGLSKLNEQLKDPTLQPALEGLFPRDDPRNTRFAINFFTSIGLGGLTDDLREHLKSQPKNEPV